MTNGIISQSSSFGGKTAFGNPFMVRKLNTNNIKLMCVFITFLIILIFKSKTELFLV
jgi:hypothetical protein